MGSGISIGLRARPWLIAGGSLIAIAALVFLLLPSNPTRSSEKELVLFCAAGVATPVKEVCAQYEQEYGVRVQVEPAGSGALLSKLAVAPQSADLFLAAEESYINEARGRRLVAEVLPVARQHAAIAVAAGNPHKIASPGDLLKPEVRVAVPNPELAAVGRAVKRTLTGTGQWDALMERTKRSDAKVSLVGTVTEAAQAVKLGAADAAIIWDATAKQFGLEYVETPALSQNAAEDVLIAVSAGTARPSQALHFARYLTARDRGEPVLEKNFYQPVADADVWQDRPALVLMAGAMLKPAIDDLVKGFSEREGVEINTIYAGCGIHVAQMKAMKSGESAAAHFPDAYFACDCSFMDKVQQWFEASKKISRNDIVMAVVQGNPKGVRSIKDLTRPELRIGLAHPRNSALGALFDDLLKKLQMRDQVYTPERKQPIVHADAGHVLVNQMRAGALDLIVVYRSNVLSSPGNAGTPIEIVDMNLPEAIAIQPYAVSKDSEHKYLMRRLLQAIVTPESEEHFKGVGFQWIAGGDPR